MPHRALAITSRHHPVAVGCYVGLTVLAVLYLADIASAATLTDETSSGWAMVWQISLLCGGLLAIAGILAPAKRILTGLVLEAYGAAVLGIELGVYVLVLTLTLDSTPWASSLVFGAVAAGCLCRTYTAMRDRRRVILGVRAAQAALTLAAPE